MNEALLDIRERIQTGRFTNEAAVRRGIVERLLDLLSWPVYDTDIVVPEYALEGRRVDYALCPPPGGPVVFIEVKQPGQGNGADRQLFEYAFHRGVPMAILTDGPEWHFFLPAEQGDYGERRVYKLDILERGIAESAERLRRYLEYRRVCSGEALESARRDYRDVAKDRQIQRTLPEAWGKLVDDADDLLVDLIAEKVESLCGYKPDLETVASFLAGNLRLSQVPPATIRKQRSSTKPGTKPATKQPMKPSPASTPRIEPGVGFGFVLFGQPHPASSARDVLVKVLVELAERDAGFLDRLAALESRRGHRRYVARSREELYPASPHLAKITSSARGLAPGSGWWVDLNLSRSSIEKVIKKACEIAVISYGDDLTAEVGADL